MHNPVGVSLRDIVRRARSVCREGKYQLGLGGRDPNAQTPFQSGFSDCSGFVAWCIGLDRYQPERIDGGWIETTAVAHDAAFTQRMFEMVKRAEPGDIIVYPDRDGRQGHVGIVSEAAENGSASQVIHCSMGNYRTLGVAVAETGPDVFTHHGAIVVRFKGAVEDAIPAA